MSYSNDPILDLIHDQYADELDEWLDATQRRDRVAEFGGLTDQPSNVEHRRHRNNGRLPQPRVCHVVTEREVLERAVRSQERVDARRRVEVRARRVERLLLAGVTVLASVGAFALALAYTAT